MSLATAGPYWDNKSIGLGPTETLRSVNEMMTRLPGASTNYATWLLLRYARRSMGKLLAIAASYRPKAPSRLMSERNRQRLREIAESDCNWLEEHYGVRLTGPETEKGRPGDHYQSGLGLAEIDTGEVAPRPPTVGDRPSTPAT
jgi:hypothetical protein